MHGNRFDEKVNGWTNRETWVVNLHFGDAFHEYIEENMPIGKEDFTVPKIADLYESFVDDYVEEELDGLSHFIEDMLGTWRVDWFDLAESVYEEYKDEVGRE